MSNISAVIITKNEEKNLPACLDSLTWADEIVIVDSGSIDNTLETAYRYGCKVKQSDWLGFGRTKQLAVNSAKNDWVLSIDADEILTKELIEHLKEIDLSSDTRGYRIKRSSFYLGKKIKYSGWQRDYPLRLFNRRFGSFNENDVHESVQLTGSTGYIEFEMLHYTYPDLQTHLEKINFYSTLSAGSMFDKGRSISLAGIFVRTIVKFFKMYFINLGFMDGRCGLLLAVNSSYGIFIKYGKLWQLNR